MQEWQVSPTSVGSASTMWSSFRSIAKKVIYGRLRSRIGRILRDLCDQRGVELVEGHAHGDHVHLCLSIPPKSSVSHTVGFLKGKSAVRIHREILQERRMIGLKLGRRGIG